MSFSDEAHAVMQRFEAQFGEGVPMMMMPDSEEDVVALLRKCIEEGSTEPIDRQFPPGAIV